MRGGTIFFGLLTVLAIAAIVGLCLRPSFVIGVSEKSLAYSVRQAADAEEARCREVKQDELYGCTVGSDPDTAEYVVKVDDYGCWDAVGRDGDTAEALDGCITIMDLIRLDD